MIRVDCFVNAGRKVPDGNELAKALGMMLFNREMKWDEYEEEEEVEKKEPTKEKNFMKFDDGKLLYSLIPQEAIDALAEVLTYGAKKYEPNNWKKCENPIKYEDALYRHLAAYRKGETIDDESGLPHLYHALCNIAFLIYFDEKAMADSLASMEWLNEN